MNRTVVPPLNPSPAIAFAIALASGTWIDSLAAEAPAQPRTTAAAPATSALAAPNTTTNLPGAVLIALQGRVDVQRAGAPTWERAQTNQVLFAKDKLRTGPRSRASLQLSNLSIQRVDELSNIEVLAGERTAGFQMELKEGGLYFFNREKPVDQRFKTPVASGAILGTEFALRVAPNGETTVSLLEGRIDLSNAAGSLQLEPGTEARVSASEPPHKTGRLDAVAAVQWCLYYPAILDLTEIGLATSPETSLTESLKAYREGNLPEALALYPEGRVPTEPSERLYLANLVLAAGQVSQSEQWLQGLPQEAARALRGLIQTVRGTPGSEPLQGAGASTLLAQSYIAQSARDLNGALAKAKAAVTAAPHFGYAWARLAELEFSHGHSHEALEALHRAFQISPANANAWTIQGFALASQNKTAEALESFNQAVALNPAMANAWLGRGLCRIRSGNLNGGRVDLQVAAATEPNRAILRSYLSKAWDLEGRTALAEKEVGRAFELDPADPTASLYAALIEQRQNRINSAIENLEKSKELNDNRAVYRSGMLLDQDRAMRAANLAGVYRDAGMTERSVREAARAVADDYGNASAHQFLADSYYGLRDPRQFNLRYETPWQSELLLSQLLAPVGGGSLSQYVSEGEYSKLFERDRVQFQSSTEYRSSGDWHETASQFGTFGNLSYALDVEYRNENGFSPNTDLRHLNVDGRIKQQFTPTDSGLLWIDYSEYHDGDTRQYYNPADSTTGASRGYQSTERQVPNAFLGWHHEWSPSQHTLLLAGHLDDTLRFSDTNSVVPIVNRPTGSAAPNALLTRVFDTTYDARLDAWSTEIQHIANLGAHTFIAGVRYQTGELDTFARQSLHNGRNQFPGPAIFPDTEQTTANQLERTGIYAYDTWRVLDSLNLTAGLSYDRMDYPRNIDLAPLDTRQSDAERVSPKVGLTWSPLRDTQIRAAWTRSLGGLFYDSSVRLEPVQISGFNQAFRSILPESAGGIAPGSRFETFGLGIDQKFPTRTYVSVSAEWLRSESEQSFGAFDWNRQGLLAAQPTTLMRRLEFDERTLSLAVNQLLGNHWSVGMTYRLSEAELDSHYPTLPAGISNDPNASNSSTLHQVGGNLRLFLDCGFFAEMESVWNRQNNQGYVVELPGDDFWQFNLYAGHRFFHRRAEVRLGILNLGNQNYRLNPLNLHDEYPRERTFFASVRLLF